MIHRPVIVVLIVVLPCLALAQWIDFPVPGTPRTADGKANLTAPTPRMPDSKPNLSGVWTAVGDRVATDSLTTVRNRHAGNIAADLPQGAPFTAWAKGIYDARRASESRDIPTARCLPSGIPPDMLRPGSPFKIIQNANVTVILLEDFNNWRQIFTDGRHLPDDPLSAWFGYSIGNWEGDAFVVETTGFNDQTWLDGGGTPHSEQLRLTERFRRIDFGHMEVQFTFDDPKAFTKVWSATVQFLLQPDTDLLDNHCENERDASHLLGK